MPIIYSNCGNITGPGSGNLDIIVEMLNSSQHVKLNVWYNGGVWYMGEGRATESMPPELLRSGTLLCRAFDVRTLSKLLELETHCFVCPKNGAALTSRGMIWAESRHVLPILMPSYANIICRVGSSLTDKENSCYAVCSDYVASLR